jgi:hypothetical protein
MTVTAGTGSGTGSSAADPAPAASPMVSADAQRPTPAPSSPYEPLDTAAADMADRPSRRPVRTLAGGPLNRGSTCRVAPDALTSALLRRRWLRSSAAIASDDDTGSDERRAIRRETGSGRLVLVPTGAREKNCGRSRLALMAIRARLENGCVSYGDTAGADTRPVSACSAHPSRRLGSTGRCSGTRDTAPRSGPGVASCGSAAAAAPCGADILRGLSCV